MRLALLIFLCGCQSLDEKRTLAALDERHFRCKVQPVLTRNCAALACHGDGNRYFRQYSRNRLRLGGTEETRNAALTAEERAFNFEAARAFVQPDDLLLMKPLSKEAGGWHHPAYELFKDDNVFASADDPELLILRAWASGAKEDPACVEPGSDL